MKRQEYIQKPEAGDIWMFKKFISACALVCMTAVGHAQTFDLSTRTLVLPSVQVGNTVYHGVTIRMDNFTVLGVTSSSAVNTVSATCSTLAFTSAKYSAIRIGMTIQEVKNLLGCEYAGYYTTRTNTNVRYVWATSNFSANIAVYFDITGEYVYGINGSTTVFKTASGF